MILILSPRFKNSLQRCEDIYECYENMYIRTVDCGLTLKNGQVSINPQMDVVEPELTE